MALAMLALHTQHLGPPMASCKAVENAISRLHLSVHWMRVMLCGQGQDAERPSKTSNSPGLVITSLTC